MNFEDGVTTKFFYITFSIFIYYYSFLKMVTSKIINNVFNCLLFIYQKKKHFNCLSKSPASFFSFFSLSKNTTSFLFLSYQRFLGISYTFWICNATNHINYITHKKFPSIKKLRRKNQRIRRKRRKDQRIRRKRRKN